MYQLPTRPSCSAYSCLFAELRVSIDVPRPTNSTVTSSASARPLPVCEPRTRFSMTIPSTARSVPEGHGRGDGSVHEARAGFAADPAEPQRQRAPGPADAEPELVDEPVRVVVRVVGGLALQIT